MHSGEKREIAKAKGEANILAWNAQINSDLPPLDPGMVVLSQLRVAVMRADLLGERLRLLVEAEKDGGFVGRTFALGRENQRIEMGEAARGMAKLEAEWRDRAVRFAKTAHDMGIAQATLELEQGKAQIVVRAFLASLAVLKLKQAQHDLALETFLGGIEKAEAIA